MTLSSSEPLGLGRSLEAGNQVKKLKKERGLIIKLRNTPLLQYNCSERLSTPEQGSASVHFMLKSASFSTTTAHMNMC